MTEQLYEIINPHDKYTLKAPDFLTAAAAVLLLGEGKYGLEGNNGDVLPVFLLGGAGEWVEKHFGDFVDWAAKHRLAIADALESVMSMGHKEREAFDFAMARLPEDQREAYRAEVHDKCRSSMSDLGAYAWDLAKRLREDPS